MKFLIVTNHSYMLWQFRRELIGALLEKGKVVLCMPFVGHENDFAKMGCKCIDVNVNRRGMNPFQDLYLYKTYKRIIREENPDKVITYSIKPNIYAGYICRRLKIPYFVNVQGLGTAFQKKVIATVASMMYRVALKKATSVFFENEANAQVFVRRNIIDLKQKKVLNGAGVNLEHYSYQPYPEEEKGIRFLFVGRIMKEKGVDELFEAARQLKCKYGNKIEFHLIGFFEDEYKDTVEQLVKENVIKFHGFQSDTRTFYAMCHCIVLPSYHEGMSNVLLEAAATGRALITTNISGCMEAVEHEESGYLCERQNVNSLEKYMENFLLLTAEQRERMGLIGRRKMEEQFDKDKIVNETLASIMKGN